jgi:hypothetical protein
MSLKKRVSDLERLRDAGKEFSSYNSRTSWRGAKTTLSFKNELTGRLPNAWLRASRRVLKRRAS